MLTVERIGVRELRKSLSEHIKSGKVTAIGGPYELRAFLVSVPNHDAWDHTAKRKALATAKRNLRAAVKEEEAQ
jgi:hypothetical protein